MNHKAITMRTVFERTTILQLLDEPEFATNGSLRAVRDGKLQVDHYLAVFVYEAGAQDDGTMRLKPISTTVVGVQRYTTRRLSYQGVYVTSQPHKDQILFETLRAHYRAEEQDHMERIRSLYEPRMMWTKRFPNGAGDLDTPFEFVIEDPDVADLNALFILGCEEEDGDEAE
jgi:hypothetical protein